MGRLQMLKTFRLKSSQNQTRRLPDSRILLLAAFLTLSGWAGPAMAQPKQSSPTPDGIKGSETTRQQTPAQAYFGEIELINQNGEKMRLYSDLLKDKVVVINSFFATCQGSCLPLNRNLEKVQEALGERIGK